MDLLKAIERLDNSSLKKLIRYTDFLLSQQTAAACTTDVCDATLSTDLWSHISTFLDVYDLKSLSQTSRCISRCTQNAWAKLGNRLFEGVIVESATFAETIARRHTAESVADVFRKFEHSWGFMKNPMCTYPRRDTFRVLVEGGLHTFTVPTNFGISTSSSAFVEVACELHFGPELIRSVVGVVDSLTDLENDRALTTDSWGLAFGPLSGILSSQAKFFDRFDTYSTGPFIRDHLASAMLETVGLRIGIYFHYGKIAFYRMTEESTDWECTGFVYEAPCTTKTLYPAVMLSRIGQTEQVTFQLRSIHNKPPFFPHTNTQALDLVNWVDFEDGALEAIQDNLVLPVPDMPLRDRIDEQLYGQRPLLAHIQIPIPAGHLANQEFMQRVTNIINQITVPEYHPMTPTPSPTNEDHT